MNDLSVLLEALSGPVIAFICFGVFTYLATRWLKFRYLPWPYPNPQQSAWVAIGTAVVPWLLIGLIGALLSGPQATESTASASIELKKSPFTVIIQFILYLMMFSPVLLAMKARKESWQSAGITKNNLGKSIFLGCLLALTGLATSPQAVTGILAGLNINYFWALLQFLVVGFWEEFGYRGYLQTRLCAWLGCWQGWLAASVAMALMHLPGRMLMSGLDPMAALLSCAYLIPISMWMGFLMLRTENVAAPAIVHAFADWTGLFY